MSDSDLRASLSRERQFTVPADIPVQLSVRLLAPLTDRPLGQPPTHFILIFILHGECQFMITQWKLACSSHAPPPYTKLTGPGFDHYGQNRPRGLGHAGEVGLAGEQCWLRVDESVWIGVPDNPWFNEEIQL